MGSSLLFVTALGREAHTIVRQLTVERAERNDAAVLWKGREAWVLKAGIGPERAARAIRWAGAIAEPAVVIATGSAGALAPELGVGDFVIGSEVCDTAGSVRRSSLGWVERYRQAAAAAGVPARLGRLLTSPVVLSGSLARQRAGRESGALAVEMESAALAEWAAEAGVEFVGGRAIVDSLEIEMPDVTTLLGPDGRPRPGRLLRTIVRRPAILRELLVVRSAMKRCEASLAAVHAELLSRLRSEE